MSGIIGHSMYAVLGLRAAVQRKLPLARIAQEHFASFLAGAYIGSDIQTMPEAICVDTGKEVGYGTVPLEKSPLTVGSVRPFLLTTPEGMLSPREVHERFYGRAHLLFGFSLREKSLHVPWDHLPDYFAAVADDVAELFGPGERAMAYMLGWIVHVVSDSLIKGIQPGIELNLVDGRYTTRNRPVQDLITFHEIGIKELGLNWKAMFADLTATPVEPVQLHYMRCTQPRGHLAALFAEGWKPESEATLRAVLAENRRWVGHHAEDVLASMELKNGECTDALRQVSGLNYAESVAVAEKAGFRHILWQMGEAVAAMLEATQHRSAKLAALPQPKDASWTELTQRWRK